MGEISFHRPRLTSLPNSENPSGRKLEVEITLCDYDPRYMVEPEYSPCLTHLVWLDNDGNGVVTQGIDKYYFVDWNGTNRGQEQDIDNVFLTEYKSFLEKYVSFVYNTLPRINTYFESLPTPRQYPDLGNIIEQPISGIPCGVKRSGVFYDVIDGELTIYDPSLPLPVSLMETPYVELSYEKDSSLFKVELASASHKPRNLEPSFCVLSFEDGLDVMMSKNSPDSKLLPGAKKYFEEFVAKQKPE